MEPNDFQRKRDASCPVCGESVYLWGKNQDAGFIPDGYRTTDDWQKQRARLCLSCGNLQVFTELSKKQRQQLFNETA